MDSRKISLDRICLILLQITYFRFEKLSQLCIRFCLSPFLKNIQEVKRFANLSVFIKKRFGVGRSAIFNLDPSAYATSCAEELWGRDCAILNSIRKRRNICSYKHRRNLMSYSYFVGNELHMKNKN